MNKQRKVVITTTYNEMGIIIDTKAEEVTQPNLQSTCNKLATDTISRAAAIEAMDGFNACGYVEEPFERLEKALKEIPAAEPERNWIPCSERLPEESGLYIVTNVGRWVEPVGTRYYNIRADGGFWSGHPGDKVLAWMELPPAYKEEE